MQPVKTFKVLGEDIDILVTGEIGRATSTVLIQTTPPGGGPPPHMHQNEDETFTVLEGEFELLREGQWIGVRPGEVVFGPRGHIHTFRNVGETVGRILIFVSPAGLENYFEEIAPLSAATDLRRILEISKQYGVSFHFS